MLYGTGPYAAIAYGSLPAGIAAISTTIRPKGPAVVLLSRRYSTVVLQSVRMPTML